MVKPFFSLAPCKPQNSFTSVQHRFILLFTATCAEFKQLQIYALSFMHLLSQKHRAILEFCSS